MYLGRGFFPQEDIALFVRQIVFPFRFAHRLLGDAASSVFSLYHIWLIAP